MNGSTSTLHDATRFDARIDCSSILVYVARQVLVSDQSDCMIITCESHMRMSIGKDNRQRMEAIGVANAQHAEL